jgi:hypothetical protein
MKLAWLAAAGLLVAGAPALAQDVPPAAPAAAAQAPVDPERLALAREMMQIFDVKSAMHTMFGGMAKAIRLPDTATQDQRDRVKQLYASMGVAMEASMPALMDKIAVLYAQTFTVQEMRDTLAFYQSPSGKSMMSKLPTVMSNIVPLTIGLMPEIAVAMKADYCSHRTCDKTDEVMFAGMAHAYARPAG